MEVKIACICVLYQTDISFLKNLEIISDQCQLTILVDNGCSTEFENLLSSFIVNSNKNIILVKEGTNLGLAKAQNMGIQIALGQSSDYILFLDDDSEPEPEMTKILADYSQAHEGSGIVAPDIVHTGGGHQKYWVKSRYFLWTRRGFKKEEQILENVNTVISSGSFVSSEIFRLLGGMREDYFIDYIDIEFCLRVRLNGFKISVLKNARLYHNLGERRTISKFGFSVSPTFHSSLRKYYMTRNRIITWKLYWYLLPSWFLIDLLNFVFDSLRTIVFEKDKKNKIVQMTKGFIEGIKHEIIKPRYFKINKNI